MRYTCRHALLLFVLLAFLSAKASGAEQGDLYVLGIALNQQGEQGAWQLIGPARAWQNTLAGAVLKGSFYSVDTSGVLCRSNPETATWQAVGNPEFAETQFMFAAGRWLYTIEKNGCLYRVSPVDGTWTQLGAAGDWANTAAVAVQGDHLFSVERSGALYDTNLQTAKWKQIGKPEFAGTRFLVAAGTWLYAIESDGSLHRIDSETGAWTRLGAESAWQGTLACTVVQGLLYTAKRDGTLWETNLDSLVRTKIGKPDYGNTAMMFAHGAAALTIETDGSLYRINVRATSGIDDYDWCPQEVEKVFREQGKSFYHNLNVRQVLGKNATLGNIHAGLDWLQSRATKNDLAVVYVGSHGMTEPKKGWSIGTADDQQFWARDLKTHLSQARCPVLLLIETCTSGGFARPHSDDPPVPANVTVLCACDEKQSTNNQLDMAVGEALFGRADFNHDGIVDLDEVITYVERRYRQWWPDPTKSEDAESPVIVKSASLSASRHLTRSSPALAAISDHGQIYSALVEPNGGNQYRVHLIGWSSSPGPYFHMNVAARDLLCLPGDGRPLLVEQNGTWYGARLVGESNGNYHVHYLGYNEEEWVTPARIQYPFVGDLRKTK